ncbi:MAG: endonuclease MutS2 [Isosphaeraceae bacterium]
MDTHTLGLLEYDKIRALVAARAACSLGKDAALQMTPSAEPGEIRDRLALTSEMAEALGVGLTPPFGGLHDIRHHVRRAQINASLAAEDLAETVETLRAVGNLSLWLGRIGDEFPRLGSLKLGVGEFSGVANAIESCLDSRAKILDTASKKLATIRREMGQVEDNVQETLRRMLRSPDLRRILRYPNFTMVGHHYVLPIAKEHRGEIQGSVHRTSASNETVFVEPQAIAEYSAQLSFLRAREGKEIRRILRWLSAQVGQVADSLLGTLETLAELDLIHARGRYSIDYRMTPPDINTEGKLVLRETRHPLLEALFRGDPSLVRRSIPSPASEENGPSTDEASAPPTIEPQRVVVPVDVDLGVRFQILVVTGPNTGGKTVAIKTVGLLAAMAQSGLHIPARAGSQLPVFDEVLADIGDEQSLEQSLSTFSSHVRRVTEILEKASSSSLVLLDEMGAGTDPTEGAALGRSILDELDTIGCRAIVTTHIGELKTYAFSNPRAENAAVEFDLETLMPRYRLQVGDIGQSNALQIARRLKLPEQVVRRAERFLEENRGAHQPEMEIVKKLRADAELAQQAALAAQGEAERSREALVQRLTDLQRQAENDVRINEARALLKPGDRVVVPRFGYDRPGRIVRVDLRKKLAVVAIGQMQWDVKIDEMIPQTIRAPVATNASPTPARAPGAKTAPKLEDFKDEVG